LRHATTSLVLASLVRNSGPFFSDAISNGNATRKKIAVCWTEVLAEPSHSPELLRHGFNSRPSSEEADAAGLAPFSCGLGDLEVVFSSLSPERKSMVSGSMYDLTFARFSFFPNPSVVQHVMVAKAEVWVS